MTKRVVSLMGVAAVATMVILAGCSSGPGAAPADEPAAEDHAEALVGTWMQRGVGPAWYRSNPTGSNVEPY